MKYCYSDSSRILESFGITIRGNSFAFGALSGQIAGDDVIIDFGEEPLRITALNPTKIDLIGLFTYAVAAATVYSKGNRAYDFVYQNGILTCDGLEVSDPGTNAINNYYSEKSDLQIEGFGYEYEATILNRMNLIRIHPMEATKSTLQVVEIDSFGKQYIYNIYKG